MEMVLLLRFGKFEWMVRSSKEEELVQQNKKSIKLGLAHKW